MLINYQLSEPKDLPKEIPFPGEEPIPSNEPRPKKEPIPQNDPVPEIPKREPIIYKPIVF